MILQIYTIIHTLISLIAIFTGIVVAFGMLAGAQLDGWTKWFLITAVATRVVRDATAMPTCAKNSSCPAGAQMHSSRTGS